MATSSYTVIWWSKSFAFNMFTKGPWNVFGAAARSIMFLSGIFEYRLGFCLNIFISHSNNMSVFFSFFNLLSCYFFKLCQFFININCKTGNILLIFNQATHTIRMPIQTFQFFFAIIFLRVMLLCFFVFAQVNGGD